MKIAGFDLCDPSRRSTEAEMKGDVRAVIMAPARTWRRTKLIYLGPALFLAAACTELSDTSAPLEPSFALESVGNLQSIPPGERDFSEIAGARPSFAGYFLEGDRLVVQVNDISRGADVRATIAARVGPQGQGRGGPQLGQGRGSLLSGRTIEIREVAFTYAQLNDWRNRASDEVFEFPGVVSLDLDEVRNQVAVGLTTGEGRSGVEAMFESMGVPREAYRIDVTEPVATGSTLRDTDPMIRGGLDVGAGGGFCTLGFSAVMAGDTVFFTNSHCTTTFYGFDPGLRFFQNHNQGPALGTETSG